MSKNKDPEIMDMLTFKQKVIMCTWGMMRRYKYFDFIHDGMHQKSAFEKAMSLTSKDLKNKKYE